VNIAAAILAQQHTEDQKSQQKDEVNTGDRQQKENSIWENEGLAAKSGLLGESVSLAMIPRMGEQNWAPGSMRDEARTDAQRENRHRMEKYGKASPHANQRNEQARKLESLGSQVLRPTSTERTQLRIKHRGQNLSWIARPVAQTSESQEKIAKLQIWTARTKP
jgi:hypothetical protein